MRTIMPDGQSICTSLSPDAAAESQVDCEIEMKSDSFFFLVERGVSG